MRFRKIRTNLRPRHTSAIYAAVVTALLVPGPTPVAGKAPIQQTGSYIPSAVNRMPDPNDRDKMQQQQTNENLIETANAQRKKEISADSEKLLKLAADLKDELDKTNKDTLSMSTIHKIDAIDKVVHDLKNKMKLR